jgi:uncharacterized membrane protein
MMFGYGGNGQFWQYALMGIVMIAFWGFVIWAVFGFIKSDSRGHHHHDRDARMILDSRLARGELDVEEYRRLVDALSHQSNASVEASVGQ